MAESTDKIILGVDPGTIRTGYGIIAFRKESFILLDHGFINMKSIENIPEKLEKIYDTLSDLIRKWNPDDVIVETAFYGKNIQSALKIGLARGAAILAAQHAKKSIHEYSPREIKKSVTGNGAASKEQVAGMIKMLVGFSGTVAVFDETDAIAAAICHAFRFRSAEPKSRSWNTFLKENPERIIQ